MNTTSEAPKRHWFRFSLKTSLVFTTVPAVWLGLYVKSFRDRKAAIVAIKQLYGVLGVKYLGPEWLRKIVRDDEYFYDPTGIAFSTGWPCTDGNLELAMKYLMNFQRLHDLTLTFSAVNQCGIRTCLS